MLLIVWIHSCWTSSQRDRRTRDFMINLSLIDNRLYLDKLAIEALG